MKNLAPVSTAAIAIIAFTLSGCRKHTNSPPIAVPPQPPLDALTATNFAQWKAAFPALHVAAAFYRDDAWGMALPDRTTGIPVMLNTNGQTVLFKAQAVDITVLRTPFKIEEIQMKSPIMDIDETRALGRNLCDIVNADPKDFLAWCDKVGNHWLDASRYIAGNRVLAFSVRTSFNKDKPWYINFIIQNPPPKKSE